MRLTILAAAFLLSLCSCSGTEYPYLIKDTGVTGALWVSISDQNKMCLIERKTDSIIGYYDVGINPSRTAVDLDGNCWVGMRGDTSVYNITRQGIVTRYDGFNAVRGVALDRDGNIWIANSGGGTIQKITKGDDGYTVSDPVFIGGTYFYGAVVDSKNFLWISDTSQICMYKYDLSRFPDPSAYIKIQLTQLYGFTIDTKGKVWASSNGSMITKINAETAVIEKTYDTSALGYSPTGTTFDINGKIWFGNMSSGARVLKLDPENSVDSEAMKIITISGNSPHGIGADENGYIYTINYGSGTVSKLDCSTEQEVFTYTVGGTPYMYSDFTGFIYRNVTLGK